MDKHTAMVPISDLIWAKHDPEPVIFNLKAWFHKNLNILVLPGETLKKEVWKSSKR